MECSREIKEHIIYEQLPYIEKLAGMYRGYGMPHNDLVQEGVIGLMRSLKNFDNTRNCSLRTYSSYYIKEQMLKYILDNYRIVRILTSKPKKKIFFNLKSMKQDSSSWSSQEEINRMSTLTGIRPDVILDVEKTMYGSDIDVNELNNLPADSCEIDEDVSTLDVDQISSVWHVLDDRSQQILQMRYLNQTQVSLQKIGDMMGISQERVRQIEKKALLKLRNLLNKE